MFKGLIEDRLLSNISSLVRYRRHKLSIITSMVGYF